MSRVNTARPTEEMLASVPAVADLDADSLAIVDDVVTACQALAHHGCDTGIGGHVSVRAPGEDAIWINAFDRTFGEITPDDVIKIGYDGTLLAGARPLSLGWEFHAGIYGQRPDVGAIVHSHGFWVTALASLNRPLKMRHNLCTFFWKDQILSPDDRFESIGPALEHNSTILIPWHGGITVDRNLPRAAALHVTLEHMAQLDVTLEGTDAPSSPRTYETPSRTSSTPRPATSSRPGTSCSARSLRTRADRCRKARPSTSRRCGPVFIPGAVPSPTNWWRYPTSCARSNPKWSMPSGRRSNRCCRHRTGLIRSGVTDRGSRIGCVSGGS